MFLLLQSVPSDIFNIVKRSRDPEDTDVNVFLELKMLLFINCGSIRPVKESD